MSEKEEKYDRIAEIVGRTDPHRNSERRRAWELIHDVVTGQETPLREIDLDPEPEEDEPKRGPGRPRKIAEY